MAIQAAPIAAANAPELALTSEPAPIKAKRAPKQLAQTDAEWLASLASSPAYTGIDVAREYAKAGVWHSERGRQLTRRSFINWLNRADKPLATTPNATSRRSFSDGQHYDRF